MLTLLALDIHALARIPEHVWPLLVSLLPALKTYAISFVVTAGYWSPHRRQFSRLVRVDAIATALTLLFLFLVVLRGAGAGPPLGAASRPTPTFRMTAP